MVCCCIRADLTSAIAGDTHRFCHQQCQLKSAVTMSRSETQTKLQQQLSQLISSLDLGFDALTAEKFPGEQEVQHCAVLLVLIVHALWIDWMVWCRLSVS